MKNGDISNATTPRMWMVWEGFVGLQTKASAKAPRHYDVAVRDCFTINTFAVKRIWDITYRYDIQVNVVTFLGDSAYEKGQWARAIGEYLDQHDVPVSVHALDFWVFVHEIVPSPGVFRVFDADYGRVGQIGGKATLVDPALDFDPLQ